MNRQYKKPTIIIVKFKCKCHDLTAGNSQGSGEGGAESRQYRRNWDDKE